MPCRVLQLVNDPIRYHIYPLDAIGSRFSDISTARGFTHMKASRLSAFLDYAFRVIFLVRHFAVLAVGISSACPSPTPTKILCGFIADKWLA
jgi:hypothetical protein